MLPYATLVEAEAALGRSLTFSEVVWFRYSARMPDYLLYYHTVIFLLVICTLAPLPLALIELGLPASVSPFKIQPKVRHAPTSLFQCYKDVMRVVALGIGSFQLASYPVVKFVGMRTGLPLPSFWEVALQLLVYFLVEDYLNYWIHRLLHTKWGYEKIHCVHHEFTAPSGYAALYNHWADVVLSGTGCFVGPAFVPCHMIVFWLWISLRELEAIETHSGYDFPWTPTKFVPFYGGAEYHDYHHYVGGKSQSNFGTVFTYCDYIYGTDKGYRYHKALQAKLKVPSTNYNEKEQTNGFKDDRKFD
ncbi:very-long-chain aldehyde decarbonylase GL1-10-like [Curcuma longa]|uniref:very-long-chain aldehyde decarbonylase GL1-10-like n=1 Tax=Curcuma longa TaxID=136217 RepID=UPI003D9F5B30